MAMALKDGAALRRICAARTQAAPGDPAPHRLLARYALEHERSPALARAEYAAALEKDPKDKESAKALADLDSRPLVPTPEGAEPETGGAELAALLGVGSLREMEFGETSQRRARRRAEEPPVTGALPGASEVPGALLGRRAGIEAPNPLLGLPLPAATKETNTPGPATVPGGG